MIQNKIRYTILIKIQTIIQHLDDSFVMKEMKNHEQRKSKTG